MGKLSMYGSGACYRRLVASLGMNCRITHHKCLMRQCQPFRPCTECRCFHVTWLALVKGECMFEIECYLCNNTSNMHTRNSSNNSSSSSHALLYCTALHPGMNRPGLARKGRRTSAPLADGLRPHPKLSMRCCHTAIQMPRYSELHAADMSLAPAPADLLAFCCNSPLLP